MPSLREVQHAIRRSLVEREDGAIMPYMVADGLACEQRLAIYRNTFDCNLANVLRLSYPAVNRLVGSEFFDGAAEIFVHERPPRAAYLDEYGADFAEFLAAFPPAASLPYLADVAQLEWAVNRALHAPDAVPLDAQQLAGLDSVDHDSVRFVVHPSITLLSGNYPVDAIWRAVLAQDDEALAAIDLAAAPVWLLVQRRASGVEVTRIDDAAWHFSHALFAGQPLAAALPDVSATRAATVLADHIASGRFVGYTIEKPNIDTLPSEIAA
ncbi:MAG: DNA-binding domain-containing protein [Betaproteobacteria bacterium]